MTKFARRIEALKKERGLKTSTIEVEAGLGSGTLSKLLDPDTERKPTRKTIAAISNTYGIPVNELADIPQPVALAPTVAPAPVRQTTVVRDDDYPSRGVVLALFKGKVDANVLAALASIRLDSDRDPGEAFWISEISRIERQLDDFQKGRSMGVAVRPERGDRMPP